MTKPLRKYLFHERIYIAQKRAEKNTDGLGYWAARDFLRKFQNKMLKEQQDDISLLHTCPERDAGMEPDTRQGGREAEPYHDWHDRL